MVHAGSCRYLSSLVSLCAQYSKVLMPAGRIGAPCMPPALFLAPFMHHGSVSWPGLQHLLVIWCMQKWREDWVSKEDGMAMAVYLPSPDAGMPEQTEQLRKQLTDLISSGALGKSCTLLASSAPPQAA